MAIPDQPAQPSPPSQPSPSAQPSQLSSIQHIVQLMLENRSFDHMLGFLYPNKTGPNGQPFEGLLGTEANNDANGNPVPVFQIDPATAGAYFMPGGDPGEGYANTNSQLSGTGNPPSSAKATNGGFVNNYAAAIAFDQQKHRTPLAGTVASHIMGIFTPAALPVLSGLATNSRNSRPMSVGRDERVGLGFGWRLRRTVDGNGSRPASPGVCAQGGSTFQAEPRRALPLTMV
jgi:hypothetical protein